MSPLDLRQCGGDPGQGLASPHTSEIMAQTGQPLAGSMQRNLGGPGERRSTESALDGADREGCQPADTGADPTSRVQAVSGPAAAEAGQPLASAPDRDSDSLEMGQLGGKNHFGWVYPRFSLDSLSFKGSFPFKGKGAGALLLRRIDRDQADLLALMQFFVDRAAGLPVTFTLRVTRSGGEFGSGMRTYLRWCHRGIGQRGINTREELLALAPPGLLPEIQQLDADVRWVNLLAGVYRRARSLCTTLVREFSRPGASPAGVLPTQPWEIR